MLFYFLFTMAYGSHEQHLTRRNVILLSIVPVLTVLAAATNSWHGWVWTEITIDPNTYIARYSHGWFFWVFVTYTYLLIVLGFFSLLSSALRVASIYRSQFAIILLSVLTPLGANLVYLFAPATANRYDLTPIGFIVTGMILAWAIFRHSVLDLVPVARDRLVEMMSDGVIVVDSQGRIGDLNPAMEQIIAVPATQAIGQPFEQALESAPDLIHALHQTAESSMELCMHTDSVERYFDLQCSLLRDSQGETAARIIVVRDITGRKQLEQERDVLISKLQDALAEVKTLSGLLPICANCKSIRDDQGYWHSVEAYLAERSEAEFSHGICPECMKKLYPDYQPK